MTYMQNNEGVALYGLNSYTWKLLRENLGWKAEDYRVPLPIIPSAQQPELIETSKPFLVYGGAVQPVSHLYVVEEESVSYNIYAKTSTEVNKIINLLKDAFGRMDDSAKDINEWMYVERKGRGIDRKVNFLSVNVAFSEKAEPSEQEGGWVSGFILLNIKFVSLADDPKTNGFTYP